MGIKKHFAVILVSSNLFLIILKIKNVQVCTQIPFLIRYVPDEYKTQQMCYKAILENVGTLNSLTVCCKNQEVCNKAVDNYPH